MLLSLATLLLALPTPSPTQRTVVPEASVEPALALRGEVKPRTASRRDVGGVEVRAYVRHAGEVRFETRARVDDDGRFELGLPRPAALGVDGSLWAIVEVDQPGYQRHFKKLRIGPETDGFDAIALPLRRGSTAYVSLQDDDGRPVTYATIAALDPRAPDPDVFDGALLASSNRLYDGTYALHFRSSGTYDLFARNGTGTGLRAGVRLDVERRDQELTLVVERGAILGGRLIGLDGRPLPEVPLTAWPADLVEERLPGSAYRAHRGRYVRAGGKATGSATTKADGSFEVHGLLPGRYFLTTHGPTDVPRTLFTTGDDSIELTAEAYRLVVDVLDPAGTPTTDVALELRTRTGRHSAVEGWGTVERGERARDERRFEYSVYAQREYVLTVFDERFGHVERRLTVAPGAYTTRATIQLRPERAPARLTLRVVPPLPRPARQGIDPRERLAQLFPGETTYFDVLAPETRVRLHTSESLALHRDERRLATVTCAKDEATFTLPPGEYVARARPSYPSPWVGVGLNVPLTRGPVERRVTLREGEERTLELQPWRGGYVRIALAGEGLTFERQQMSHGPLLECNGGFFRLDVHELGDDGRARRIGFALTPGDGPTFHSLDPLLPGERRLRVQGRGFEPQEHVVRVELDGTVDLDVELRRP